MAGTAKTTEIDRGEKEIRRRIAELAKTPGGPYVKAGILADAGAHKDADGLTVAEIAIFNEFGTPTIPERGFMRAAAVELTPIMKALGARMLSAYISGKLTLDQALDTMGLKAVAVIKRTIRDWEDPPNAPSTIRAKARKTGRAKLAKAKSKGGEAELLSQYNNPLEDTGQLRNSVQHEKVK
jgi:hypothetical protein